MHTAPGTLKASVIAPMQRQNNFDLLRFCFAAMVFFVHAHILSNSSELAPLSQWISSELAVKSFFVISGFWIFMSYENSSTLSSYFGKRLRRIYPAYVAVIMIAVLIGAFLTQASLEGYFSWPLIKYVFWNLLFLNFVQPTLPGVFEQNTLQAVNGALWTLKIEALFYLMVPVFVFLFNKFGRFRIVGLVYLSSLAYFFAMEHLANQTGKGFYLELQRQLPGQLTFFMAGAVAYYYFPVLSKYKNGLLFLAASGYIFHTYLPWQAVQPMALGVLVIYLACLLPYLGNFGRYGDFSYGIYILHFPILQTLVSLGIFERSPIASLVMAMLLTLIAAALFWHFIEKPFLKKSSHFVAADVTS
jgi:peptidoglycan/LPS O-acetylase OafA/YrhL